MKEVFLRTAFNYDMKEASDASGLLCEDVSLTKQAFKEECDINTIVRRFGLSGELPTGVAAPTYQDFEGIFDFHSAMNAISKAHEAFDQMPAEVRVRFSNDPAQFVDFCSQESNRSEALRLGLLVPQAAELANSGPAAKPPISPTEAPGAP